MNSWASKKLLNAGLVVALFATLTAVGFLNAPVSADAITGTSNDGLASQTERWLRLRAVTKCFNDNDIGKNSYNDVEKGAIFDSGSAALGYLNPDGKVSCDGDAGEAFVRNSLSKIGFANPVAAFCSVQPMASRGDSDSKTESNFEGCTTGSGDQFDMDSDAFDQGARQVEQFKTGYQEHAENPASWSPSPAMMYHVYRSSLVEFCGAKLIGPYDSSDENNVNADKRKVVVNDIDIGTGEIVRNVYSLSRDQTDKVDDIYVNNDMQNVSNVTCSDMAKKTWDYDKDMSDYVKAYNIANPDDVPGEGTIGGTETTGGSNEPVCSAGALGWIICPAINFIASFNDMAYAAIQNMLIIEPTTVEIGGPLYNTWTKFRDIANVLFVIAFFVVIFSQATSVGLSSYGIKKLLPRVIAAAILVNLSFFLCQIALDITNIVGVSIANLFEAMHSGSNVDVNVLSWQTVIGALLAGGAAYGGVVAVLGTGGVVGAMAAILPFLVTALFAVVTAVAILIARQVIIILLIALAPLAFVAFILPNTQKYFQLWQNTFTTMLVMFPLIAALFAGSQLAANIVLTSSTTSDGIDFFQLIAAVCILFIPLFGVPYIVKFSGGAIGRLAGVINNPSKGPFDNLRKKAEGYRDFKQDQAKGRNLDPSVGATGAFAAYNRRKANKEDRYARAKDRAGRVNQRYLSNMYSGENAPFDEASVDVSAANGDPLKESAIRARAKQEAQTRAGERFATQQLGGRSAARYTGGATNLQAELNRARAGAISQENEESRKRSAAIEQLVTHREQGLTLDQTLGMYDEAYKEAASAGDHETATAILRRSYSKGGPGRSQFAEMISKHAVNGAEAQKHMEEAIYSIANDKRADVVKGNMTNQGVWSLAGAGGMSYEQITSLDDKAMYNKLQTISPAQASHILNDDNLKSQIQTAAAQAMLNARANNVTINPSDRINPADPSSKAWDSLKENTSPLTAPPVPPNPGPSGGGGGTP